MSLFKKDLISKVSDILWNATLSREYLLLDLKKEEFKIDCLLVSELGVIFVNVLDTKDILTNSISDDNLILKNKNNEIIEINNVYKYKEEISNFLNNLIKGEAPIYGFNLSTKSFNKLNQNDEFIDLKILKKKIKNLNKAIDVYKIIEISNIYKDYFKED